MKQEIQEAADRWLEGMLTLMVSTVATDVHRCEKYDGEVQAKYSESRTYQQGHFDEGPDNRSDHYTNHRRYQQHLGKYATDRLVQGCEGQYLH